MMQVKYFTNLPSNYYSTSDDVAMPLITPPSQITRSLRELTTTTYTCDDVFQPFSPLMPPATNADANYFLCDLPVITSPPPPPYCNPLVTTCSAYHQVLPHLNTESQSAMHAMDTRMNCCYGQPELGLSPEPCHGLPELAQSPDPFQLSSDGCVDEEDWDLLRPVSESPAPVI